MKQFNQNILDVIGNTPIIKLNKVASNVASEIYVKLEYLNPGGSIKDKIGLQMCEQAVLDKKIAPGGTFIESTSGNTGVGIALYCAVHGYQAVFVMADKQSQEKINNLKAFGATVVVCPTNVEPEDPRSYYSVAKKLSETLPNSLYLNQYANPSNSKAHEVMTGPEIWEQTKGEFDIFMAGVGTGGTISGTGRFLKTKMPHRKIVSVAIKGSILSQYHKDKTIIPAHSYVLEGIGEDFLPDNVDFNVIDDFVTVEDKESFVMTRRLLAEEGIYSGGSCGAAVVGAIKYAETLKEPKKILVILPDSGNRYASKIYNDEWMEKMNYSSSQKNSPTKDLINKTLESTGIRV